MDATYERILQMISAKPRAQRELARRALVWIAYARKPLSIRDLAFAISIEMDTKSLEDLKSSTPTEKAILNACANLVSVDQGEKRVRFVHFSVQEFLTSHRSTTLGIGYEVGHREIAQACMILLTLFPKRRDFKSWLHVYAYDYAFDEWPHHLLAGNLGSLRVDDQIVTLALLFFKRSPMLLTKNLYVLEPPSFNSVQTYHKFSPPVLGLIFDLPGPQSGQSQADKAVYKDSYCMVLSNDKLAIHYAVAVLDSVPVVRRLYSHDYVLNYAYSDPDGDVRGLLWLQASPLYSVQSTQMARYLLDNGISLEPRHLRSKIIDPLTCLAESWSEECFQLLLDRVVDTDAGRLMDALQAAVLHHNMGVIPLLLDKGANINAQCGEDSNDNVLQTAITDYNSKVEVIRLLLDKGAEVNAQGGKYGNALQTAALHGKIGVTRLLLDKGADVNAQGGYFGNALQAAANDGKIEVVRLLLDKGAKIDTQGGYFGNALQAAADGGKIEVVRLLLDKGAKVDAQGGYFGNALQAAVLRNGNINVVRLLLDKGAEVGAQGGYYGNALQAVAYGGKIEVVRLLLDKGADVNAQGGHYGNALQAAAHGGNVEVVRLLLDKGAEADAQGGHYNNALQAAVLRYGNIDIVRLLLDKGADVGAQGGHYGNALQAAAHRGNIEVIRLLLDEGAEADAQGGCYGNALQAAAYRGSVQVIRLLLDNGADVNTQGGMFGTVLQAAAYRGDIEVIQLLLDKGADIHARGGKYGAALEKMLALEPAGTGQKVPGDIPLLIELLQDHGPFLLEDSSKSKDEVAAQIVRRDRCSLDVFRGLLESRGWRRGAQEEGTRRLETNVWKLFGLTFLAFLLFTCFEFFWA